jgi:hypothetical protein
MKRRRGATHPSRCDAIARYVNEASVEQVESVCACCCEWFREPADWNVVG